MSDLNPATNEQPTPQAEQPQAAQAEAFTIKDVKREFFAPTPEELAKANELHAKISAIPGVDIRTQTQLSEGDGSLPEGYGLAVIPVAQRSETGQGNVVKSVAIVAIPTVQTILAHPKGPEFVEGVILSAMMNRAANAARPRMGVTDATMPFTMNEFLEGTGARLDSTAFTETAGDVVKGLKKQGLRNISVGLLRDCLRSEAFADMQFPTIKQTLWEKILRLMVAKATQAGHDTELLTNWQNTRAEAETSMPDDIDMSKLAGMLGEEETAEGDFVPKPAQQPQTSEPAH